jgi:hypothetical protein
MLNNLVKMEAAGGIECIATSMRSHPTDGKLQLSAYLASRTGHKHRRGTDRRQSAAQVRRDLKNTAAVLGEMRAVGLTSILLCGVVELPRQCARKYLTTTQGTNAAAAHVSWAMNTDGPVTEATQLPGAWDECQVRRMPRTLRWQEQGAQMRVGSVNRANNLFQSFHIAKNNEATATQAAATATTT